MAHFIFFGSSITTLVPLSLPCITCLISLFNMFRDKNRVQKTKTVVEFIFFCNAVGLRHPSLLMWNTAMSVLFGVTEIIIWCIFQNKDRNYLESKQIKLREKCLYSELLWSAFSPIRTEYGEVLRISPYWIWMRENADQNNSEYGHLLGSVIDKFCSSSLVIFLNMG